MPSCVNQIAEIAHQGQSKTIVTMAIMVIWISFLESSCQIPLKKSMQAGYFKK